MNNIYWIWVDNDSVRCGFDSNMFKEKNGLTDFLKESKYYEEGSYHYGFRLGGFLFTGVNVKKEGGSPLFYWFWWLAAGRCEPKFQYIILSRFCQVEFYRKIAQILILKFIHFSY